MYSWDLDLPERAGDGDRRAEACDRAGDVEDDIFYICFCSTVGMASGRNRL